MLGEDKSKLLTSSDSLAFFVSVGFNSGIKSFLTSETISSLGEIVSFFVVGAGVGAGAGEGEYAVAGLRDGDLPSGAVLDDAVEGLRARAEPMLGDEQVAGGRDRQKFRDPLDDTQHHRVPEAQFRRRSAGQRGRHGGRLGRGRDGERKEEEQQSHAALFSSFPGRRKFICGTPMRKSLS